VVDVSGLAKPYYQDDLVTLYHGDCREITAWLEADVLVFDPPYGRAWRQGRLRNLKDRGNLDNHRDGIRNDSDTEVRDTVLSLWGERIGVAFGDLMLPPPPGNKLTMVYRKPRDAGVRGAIARRRRDLEAVYLVGPWPSGLGGTTSVLETNASIQGSQHGAAARYGHPHAKPVDVMAELIQLTHSGVVTDPTAGSGSTLVAARMLGRMAIGVELEECYCEVAARRLSQDSLSLFGGIT
jgi:site-specific DNA-methyltransferase (adenine-specific)